MSASAPSGPAPRLALVLLAGTMLAAPAQAQQAKATLDTIDVQRGASRPAGAGRAERRPSRSEPAPAAAAPSEPSPGPATAAPTIGSVENVAGGGSATSGGGGGPTGVVGYTAKGSPTATKTNTPIIETPASVSVVTREQLNDRNVQTLNEAIGYTPGVSANVFGYDPRFDAFYIRGFDVTEVGIYRDGLRQPSSPFAVPKIEPYGLDAITILRGPAAGLYGLGSPGGIVGTTSKRPTDQPFGEVWLQRGKYDRYQGAFDLGGPIEGSDGQLSYRMTGLFRDSGSFLPGGIDNRNFIAPAITWRPDEDTKLTILTEYLDNTVPGNASFFSDFSTPGLEKTRIYSGDPAYQNFTTRQYRIGYAFEHRFDADTVFRQNFRYYNVLGDLKYTQIDALATDPTTGLLIGLRSNGRITNALETYSLDNQIETHFATGFATHTFIAGVDYTDSRYTDRRGFLAGQNFDDPTLAGPVPSLQIGGLIRPNYGAQFIPQPAYTNATRQRVQQIGEYVQDQARIGPLLLTLTGRNDNVSRLDEDYTTLGSRVLSSDQAFSYRFGANYLITDYIVPYVSYATTFAPQLGFDGSGAPFQPTTGEQIEGGVKTQVPGTNVFINMAIFDITQNNVLRPDPANPLIDQIAVGQVRSKGAELELTANLGPGINAIFAYSHIDIRTLRNPGAPETVGLRLSGIPTDTISSFVTYAFPTNFDIVDGVSLYGLSFGGGVRFAGPSPANDVPGIFQNSTVTLFDAVAAYDFVKVNPALKGMRAQVNVNNLLDRNYFNCQAGACYRGQPRQFYASLIYRW